MNILNNNFLIKTFFIYLISILLIILIINKILLNNDKCKIIETGKLQFTDKEELNKIKIDLSLKLNQAYQKIGRLNCKINQNQVSDSGGWCSSISGRNSSKHVTDDNFAKALSDFLANKRVASFGDGPGVYKEKIEALGKVISYDAFDGAPFVEITTDNRVKFLDLTLPIYHLKTYDWVVSVEVAEHIPKEFEHIYVDNLVRHAKEGIILSWSKVGQIGHSHVNNQNFDYVKSIMEKKCFNHDNKNSLMLKNYASLSWIKNNVNVYRRSDCSNN
jgi:hypothetical protein